MATILIVDDRPANREFLVTLLGYGGHRLLEAADGAEALALTRAERPDLVITDILMPTMDGYEFVHQLRADPTVAATRVVFCTAQYHEPEARSLAEACGVFAVLTKPCEPELVLRTVEAALGNAPLAAPIAPADEFEREHRLLLTDKLSQKADELRRTNERLKALLDLGLPLGSERDPGRLLQIFCDSAREIIGARHALVGVPNGDDSYRHFRTSGMDVATVARLGRPDPFTGVLGSVVTAGRCFRTAYNGGKDAVGVPPTFPSARALLLAPVVSPVRVYGWICLLDKLGADAFTEEDEQLVKILAAQVGRIYENGSLYTDLLHHSAKLAEEVADRKRAEEALRLRDRAIQAVQQGILITDPSCVDNPIIFASPGFERLTGYTAAEALGRNCRFLQGTDTDPESVARIREAVRTGEPCIVELLNYRKDGASFWNEFSMSPVRDDAGRLTHFVSVLADATGRRSLEEQLRQAQKMEAVGQLAGGVAHDFNNLLTIINGYSELLIESLPPADSSRALIQEIHKAGERSAGLTRQLLAFSRQQILAPRILDLNAVVSDAVRMLQRVIGEDVELTTRLVPGLGPVRADAGQIEQVLMNLAVNGRDAMPTGGRLTIETRNVDLEEPETSAPGSGRPGPHVLLTVADTGTGMSAAVQAKIFEPFFTTKEPGKGTGFGLATVYGIVRQSNGHIRVHSAVGFGATFEIYLPRVERTAETGEVYSAPRTPPRGSATVLLVEDEAAVRALVQLVLDGRGYTVLEAVDGVEGLRVAGEYGGPIHLLVSDVVMPGMGGPALAARLAEIYPDLRILFMSGYTDDAVVRHGILRGAVNFIQKPFSPLAFAAKVAEVLGLPPTAQR